MTATFFGFEREDGSVGTRNYVAVIPTVFCANEVASKIANDQASCRALVHNKGCGQLKPDLDIINRTLIGLGLNPNVGAVLLVSLGCEAVDPDRILDAIARKKRMVEQVNIQMAGGMPNAVMRGRKIVDKLSRRLSAQKRTRQSPARICVAVKCGSSDATSGLSANPATGKAVDEFVRRGATVIFGETTEFIGAEHLLVVRGAERAVSQKILNIVSRMEERIIQMGVDMRGTQPSRGNIADGLTTIEEKSLGAISKSGTRPITDVVEYGERIEKAGLFIMDSPGKEDEFLTGVSAAGANVVIFTTGGGAPQGFPLVPVIKVAGNPDKVRQLRAHVDIDAGSIIDGTRTIKDVGCIIFDRVMRVASGDPVAAEIHQCDKTIGIYTLGPTI